MPFKSEKQRRFLWAEHPDIARRWADEYPLNGKKLPMYAKDKAENSDEQSAKSEADVVKAAKDILKRIKMPTNTGPTYAGQTDISSEQASTSILDENTPKTEETAGLDKCSMIPGTDNAQRWENEKARNEGRPAQRISAVPGVKRQIVPNIYNPLPMALSAQSGNSSPKPAAAQSATPANDAANRLMKNTIGNFGPIAADGNLNGNAAFGVKNSPNSSKTSNYRASEKSARISAPMCPCGCNEKSYNCTCPKWCVCRNPGMPCAPKKRKANTKTNSQNQKKAKAPPNFLEETPPVERMIDGLLQTNKTHRNINTAVSAVSPMLLNALGKRLGFGVGPVLSMGANLGHAGVAHGLNTQQKMLQNFQGRSYLTKQNSALTATTNAVKTADENFNLVYPKHKPNYIMPKHLRDDVLSPEDAQSVLRAFQGVSRHNALDNTRLDWHGLKIRGYSGRVQDNDKITRLGRWLHHQNADEFERAYPDKTQGFGDAFFPYSNVVTVPSGMGGTLMHELGHAVDYNEFPSQSTPRHLLAAMYRNYAPTLWKEHAAWRKGRRKLLDAFADEKIDTNLTNRVLTNAAGTKRLGLGSYWGGSIGGLVGGGAGLLAAIALNKALYDNNVNIRIGGRLAALPVVLGGALGVAAGTGLGHVMSRKPVAQEKIVNMMAHAASKKRGISYAEARRQIEETLKAKKPASKNTQMGEKKSGLYAPKKPAQYNANLHQMLQQWEQAGGGPKYGPQFKPQPLPPELAMAVAKHMKLRKGEMADDIDAAHTLLELEDAQMGEKKSGLFDFLQPDPAALAEREHNRQLYAMHQQVLQQMAEHKKKNQSQAELDQLYEKAMQPLYEKQMEFMYNKPEKQSGSPAWQRSAGKNPEGGLNEKGRKSYERETGGNLKAPVTESNPKGERKSRRASFCARMGGMKKKLTGKDTASDPDSRINKALRKWNCKSSEEKQSSAALLAAAPLIGGAAGLFFGPEIGDSLGLPGSDRLHAKLGGGIGAGLGTLPLLIARRYAAQNKSKPVKREKEKNPATRQQKTSAYKGITEFSGMPGPDQISHAVSQLGMLKALVRPDDSVLKQRGITRSGFQSGLRDIYNHSRNKDRFELSELAPQPNTHAALGGLGGLGAAGLLGYAGVRDPAVLAGTAVIPAIAAYFHARNKRHNLLNTAKLVKDYGLLRPKLLRQAYPLLAADD